MTAATERTDPRAMLALIALAGDLPVPAAVRFYNDAELAATLILDFEFLSTAAAWCAHLGGDVHAAEEHDGRRWFRSGRITWLGWSVQIHASEPAATSLPGEALSEDVTEGLAALVPARGGDGRAA
jgi:hypothetical protein